MSRKNLVELDEYKAFANIYNPEHDERLEPLVLRVSEFIKTYCARSFVDNFDSDLNQYTDIVEYTNSPGAFFPAEFPLRGLGYVEVSMDRGITYAPASAVLDIASDLIHIDGSYEGINAYRVCYTAGYSETPEDLKLAAIDLIEYYRNGEATPRKTSGNVTMEFITSSDVPAHIKRVLDLYRALK